MNINSIKHILEYMEKNDSKLYLHSERTSMLCYILAQELKLSSQDLELSYMSGLLHDIGKLCISDKIKVKINNEDYFISSDNLYSRFTICTLKNYTNMESIIEIIKQHQENHNGSGLPGDISGEDIHPIARILKICDYYDTQIMNGLQHEEITKLLRKNSNILFYSKIITPFIKSIIKNDIYIN